MKVTFKNGNEMNFNEVKPSGAGLILDIQNKSVDEADTIIGGNENLELIKIATSAGITVERYYNLEKKRIILADGKVTVELVFKKAEVTVDVASVLNSIQNEVAALEETQEIQDSAITELAEMAAEKETVEGGV